MVDALNEFGVEAGFQDAAVLLPTHAADRLTTRAWFNQLEPEGAPSSNVEAQGLPFQRWYRFKEAFSPRFVSAAIGSLPRRPSICIDPFGGSGTTALTCQFLGIQPITIEVNPFLSDLIEAKLSEYDISSLITNYSVVVDEARSVVNSPEHMLKNAPATFVEPGVNNRWLFDREVAARLLAYRKAIETLDEPAHRRLFKVLLGSIAIGLSNVVISGKGRRYRSGWNTRRISSRTVDGAFGEAVERAIQDIARFGRRAERNYILLRGDARQLIGQVPPAEFALFSPPYPNSFDYTDIYNVELWLLGYFASGNDNRLLREATLRSHVQIKRPYGGELPSSNLLLKTVAALEKEVKTLWDADIPSMIRAYFSDLSTVLRGLASSMQPGANVMMVVGDSHYAGIRVDVVSICTELAPQLGFTVRGTRPIRAMRTSAQQGGRHVLDEALIHLSL